MPPLAYGREQVDDLDAGLEHLARRREVLDVGAGGGSASARCPRVDLVALVDRLAEQVEDAAERRLADGHADRPAGVAHLGAAREAVGRVHGHGAHAVVAQVLLHLADQDLRDVAGVLVGVGRRVRVGHLDLERVVDLGQVVGVEHGLDHDALDLLDAADRLVEPFEPFSSLLLLLALFCACFQDAIPF